MSSPFEQLGRILEPLVDQPAAQRILSGVSAGRDLIMRVQSAAMSALGVPTSTEVGQIERRVRGLSDSLASVEEQLDRLEARLSKQTATSDRAELDKLRASVEALRKKIAPKK